MQGVGAAGLMTVAGTPVIAGQQGDDGTAQEQGTALRVAHASPDAPSVDVYLAQAGGGGAGTDDVAGNETAGGAAGDDTVGDDGGTAGGDNATIDGGNETVDGDAGTGGDDSPAIEGLEYGDVSNYEAIDSGSYQVRIVATETSGPIEGMFEAGEEPAVFDQEVELEEGTTYTAVAYGALARMEGDGATQGDGTDDATGAGDDATGGADDTTGGGDTDGAGDETAGTGEDGDAAGAETTDEQAGDGESLVDGLAFGEHEYVTLDPENYVLEFRAAESSGVATDGDGAGDDTGDVGEDTAGGQDDAVDAGQGDETTGDQGDAAGDGQADDTAGGMDGGSGADGSTAFQVELLEDDLSVSGTAGDGEDADGGAVGNETDAGDAGGTAGGENETDAGNGGMDGNQDGTSRIRLFNAVLDVPALEVVAFDEDVTGDGANGGGQANETAGDQDGDSADGGTDGTAGDEDADGAGTDATGAESDAQTSRITAQPGTVYSGFAMGHLDVEETDTIDDGGAAGGQGENETVGDDQGGNDTVAGQGDETTGDQGDTAGNESAADGQDGDDVIADEGDRGFQFVSVEDATDGERSDGGSGTLLGDISQPTALSD